MNPIYLIALVGLIVVGWLLFRWIRHLARELQLARARESFHLQQARLEEIFLKAAASQGKPRGLHWVACHFLDKPLFVRDRLTRKIAAFIATTVQFQPVAGSDMEHIEAAIEPRLATAVLHFRRGAWVTDGRVLFNMDPQAALLLLANHYESIASQHLIQKV